MAAIQKFSIRSALKFGFNAFIDHIWLFIQLIFAFIGLSIATALVSYTLFVGLNKLHVAGIMGLNGVFATFTTYALVVFTAAWTLRLIVTIGITGIYLDIVDEKKVSVSTLFNQNHLVLKALLASWLYSFLVLLGLMLCIVPGIMIAVIYNFFLYELVDRNCGIFEAFTRSAAITKGSRLKLFQYLVIDWIVSWVFIVLKPITTLGEAYIYRQLDQRELHNFLNTPIFE